MAEDRVTRSLEKLKMTEKNAEPKKSNLAFRDINDMDFDTKPVDKESKSKEIEDPTLIRKLEVVTRKMDEVVSKMSAGSNYLMFYGQMQELEGQFLDMTKDIELKKESIPPQLFNRLISRKQEILRKRKK